MSYLLLLGPRALLLPPAADQRRGNGYPPFAPAPSVSVSVSVSSREREAGFAEREKRRTVSRPPCSFEGKCTFLWVEGVVAGVEGPEEAGEGSLVGDVGAERARGWWSGWEWVGEAMAGDEEDDLRDDFRGLPLERKMGVDDVRATLGRAAGGGVGAGSGEGCEEERGNGTGVVLISRLGAGVFSLSTGGMFGICLSSLPSSGEESSSSWS
jgi:hypothetical protein